MSPAYSEATHQRFLKRLTEKGFKLVGEYINVTTPVEIECSQGHRKTPTPNNIFKENFGCRECTSQQTKQRFLAYITAQNYTLLTPYTTSIEDVQLRCQYNHTWWVMPYNCVAKQMHCRVCSDWATLQKRTFKSPLARQTRLFRYAQKHGIPYRIPKHRVPFKSSAEACKVVKCEPTQHYLQEIIETHTLPWDVVVLTRIMIAMEKWKFTYYPTKTIGKHKQTMVAVLLYWWGQRVGLKYSQLTICEWVKITVPTLKNWLRRFRPFFCNIKIKNLFI